MQNNSLFKITRNEKKFKIKHSLDSQAKQNLELFCGLKISNEYIRQILGLNWVA